MDQEAAESPGGVQVATTIHDDHSRSIINAVDSPDISMKWTLNPYRGCEHGCIYCYARPGHEYLSLSCGVDFETRIFAKREAPKLLRDALSRPSWRGEPIAMSGVTDPYQPIERDLRITRACLEVMLEFRQPVFLITKNRLITRDLDLLRGFASWQGARAAISLTTLDPKLASRMEPRASSPRDRLRAISELSEAGIPVSVMTAPIIPGLTDHEIPALLQAAAGAGATSGSFVMLRLPHQIKALFLEWLQRHYPLKAARVEALLRDVRGGELYDASFGSRMRGTGAFAESIARTFKLFAARYHLNQDRATLSSDHFKVPARDGQIDLFGS